MQDKRLIQACEEVLLGLAEEMKQVYDSYNPDGKYLTVGIVNGSIFINNSYDSDDKDFPIDITKLKEEEN